MVAYRPTIIIAAMVLVCTLVPKIVSLQEFIQICSLYLAHENESLKVLRAGLL